VIALAVGLSQTGGLGGGAAVSSSTFSPSRGQATIWLDPGGVVSQAATAPAPKHHLGSVGSPAGTSHSAFPAQNPALPTAAPHKTSHPATRTRARTAAVAPRRTSRTRRAVDLKQAHASKARHASGATLTRRSVTAPATPGLSSMNWAGYVLTGKSYREVSAEWTVPSLNCRVVPNGSTSDWVGVDGWVHPVELFQAGTSSTCAGGVQANSVVWSDGALGYAWQDEFTVNAGDEISAQVARSRSGAWTATVTDESTGQRANPSEPVAYAGASAEWVAEDSGIQGSSVLAPLADFTSVSFAKLSVTPAGLPSYADAIEMLRANGSVAAIPAPIRRVGSSSSFTVAYEPSS